METTKTRGAKPTANSVKKRAAPSAASGLVAKPRKRLTRAQLAPVVREELLAAATRVVGELGYAEASVARITEAAGIAQGTFYLYFESRQSLFDELLPHARREMLDLVRSRLSGARDFFEVEERGLRAFLEYLDCSPGFLRILNEAEVVAPEAYRCHYQDIANRYARLLRRACAVGQVRPLDDAAIQTASYLMMGTRISLYQLCVRQDAHPRISANQAVANYMTMVRAWLSLAETRRPSHRASAGAGQMKRALGPRG